MRTAESYPDSARHAVRSSASGQAGSMPAALKHCTYDLEVEALVDGGTGGSSDQLKELETRRCRTCIGASHSSSVRPNHATTMNEGKVSATLAEGASRRGHRPRPGLVTQPTGGTFHRNWSMTRLACISCCINPSIRAAGPPTRLLAEAPKDGLPNDPAIVQAVS